MKYTYYYPENINVALYDFRTENFLQSSLKEIPIDQNVRYLAD